jgi:hypothetical protein
MACLIVLTRKIKDKKRTTYFFIALAQRMSFAIATLIDEPHIQLSLLNADFPFSFKATEKRGETSVRLCVERRARYHNSFLISLSRPRTR